MDDLIVILLTILVAVVGVLNQRKKKKEGLRPGAESAGQPADFWEMLMQQEEQRPVYQPFDEEEEPAEEVVVAVPKPEPVYSFKAEAEGSSEVVEKMKILQRPQKKKVLIDGERFSIRKAVIYNEIMNRKYT
ncbi:hypothetical protein [Maribellus sp. YY47]|uniref:hypothetical protein n=1 Tax=Maribellus sp. YY47 TaxID=2929486 RepID=UPI00200184F3|nr:hypothetical protein [Maribellus sp. YY47]MCK3683853.1 hypothetical protein [Maribellus sp. YY47]